MPLPSIFRRWLASLALLLALPAAAADVELPPVDDVFVLSAQATAPDRIEVRLGETIRFTHENRGAVMHEMVVGTPKTLAEHAEMMQRFPEMEHDEPWMSHVAPGGRGEMIWHFNRAGEFQFACLIPGHFQAGMIGTIKVG